ncbi:hypothetical protein QNI16_15015 [Cytophagaceae bacterium YF14B1]|uniref:Uncharacterized protein n=1 Tax=Xanthocytophaga flava TaxID=3048013 RepID=A0AAE3QS26_9BACT|nr:hypothetical protein [Xanthocytophaga flavus]MDJ1481809.1 hypothetical protein [Xanthocytophaga flavus]
MTSPIRFIGFYIQVFLVVVTIISFLTFQPAGIFLGLIFSFFIGIWQVISAIVCTIRFWNNHHFIRRVFWYWLLVIISLSSFGFLYSQHILSQDISFAILFGLSAITALYYLFITYQLLYSENSSSSSI